MRFSDIPGHEAEKAHLRSLVDSGRMPHALLLCGPPGSGKLALARATAQYIHCTSRRDGDSCGVCPSCRQHASHNNPDMYSVYPILKKKGTGISGDYIEEWRRFLDTYKYASFAAWLETIDAGNSQPMIYVEEAMEIIRRLSLSNYSAEYKVMLVWLPERFHPATANKLLKIIEEPWADTKMIFVSNEPQNILPTIYSRTQRLNVRRLGEEEMAEALAGECGLEPSDARETARLAQGNLNTAMELVGAGGEKEEFRDLFQKVMRLAYMRDVRALREEANRIASFGREKQRRMLGYFSRQVRENFISNLGVPQLNVMGVGEEAFSRKFGPFINGANAPRMTESFDRAAADIMRNANAKMVLFDTFIDLIISLRMK